VGYPSRSVNKNKEISTQETVSAVNNTKKKKFQLVKNGLKEFLMDLKKSIQNVTLLLVVFATASEGILLKGFLGFISKYFEYQFQMTASTSTLITGSIALGMLSIRVFFLILIFVSFFA